MQGALCKQKDDRALRELDESQQEDDQVIYDEDGSEPTVHTSTYIDGDAEETEVDTIE